MLAVDSNLLIIAVCPSEESSRYGGLIAELCRRGRPPFVTILTDGSSGAGNEAEGPHRNNRFACDRFRLWRRRVARSGYSDGNPEAVAAAKAAAARRAVAHLGLPPERLLLIGLHDGAGSAGPEMVDALVSAFDLLSWARDCQMICVNGDAPTPDHALARSLGERLSLRAGLGCVTSFPAEAPDLQGGRLDVTRHHVAKTRAMAEYAADFGPASVQEYLALLRAPIEGASFWAPSLAKNG
jgi:LmbE family N-acetylglucosaminyl deacetylase